MLNLLAGPTGLEPATSGVTGRRSSQLNYDPVFLSCRPRPCDSAKPGDLSARTGRTVLAN